MRKIFCKRTVLGQLIIENVVTCFLRHSVCKPAYASMIYSTNSHVYAYTEARWQYQLNAAVTSAIAERLSPANFSLNIFLFSIVASAFAAEAVETRLIQLLQASRKQNMNSTIRRYRVRASYGEAGNAVQIQSV